MQDAQTSSSCCAGTRGFTVRTISLTDPSQRQLHRAAITRLQWGALSDDEEAAGAPAMDGYTSSDDSYGGHMAGFAFEGAVSEADPYEEELIRCMQLISGYLSKRSLNVHGRWSCRTSQPDAAVTTDTQYLREIAVVV